MNQLCRPPAWYALSAVLESAWVCQQVMTLLSSAHSAGSSVRQLFGVDRLPKDAPVDIRDASAPGSRYRAVMRHHGQHASSILSPLKKWMQTVELERGDAILLRRWQGCPGDYGLEIQRRRLAAAAGGDPEMMAEPEPPSAAPAAPPPAPAPGAGAALAAAATLAPAEAPAAPRHATAPPAAAAPAPAAAVAAAGSSSPQQQEQQQEQHPSPWIELQLNETAVRYMRLYLARGRVAVLFGGGAALPAEGERMQLRGPGVEVKACSRRHPRGSGNFVVGVSPMRQRWRTGGMLKHGVKDPASSALDDWRGRRVLSTCA